MSHILIVHIIFELKYKVNVAKTSGKSMSVNVKRTESTLVYVTKKDPGHKHLLFDGARRLDATTLKESASTFRTKEELAS